MKDKILHTALDNFLTYGIRKMSIQKLVEPLGISTKTVYKYFRNKEELLEQVLNLYYTRQYKLLENHSADQMVVPLLIDIWYTAIEREYSINKAFFHDLHYYYPELDRKTETAYGEKFWKQFKLIIHKGIKSREFRKDIHPEVALEGIAILYHAVGRTKHFKRFHLNPHELFLNTIAHYIRGLCTQKGVRELDRYMSDIKPIQGKQ